MFTFTQTPQNPQYLSLLQFSNTLNHHAGNNTQPQQTLPQLPSSFFMSHVAPPSQMTTPSAFINLANPHDSNSNTFRANTIKGQITLAQLAPLQLPAPVHQFSFNQHPSQLKETNFSLNTSSSSSGTFPLVIPTATSNQGPDPSHGCSHRTKRNRSKNKKVSFENLTGDVDKKIKFSSPPSSSPPQTQDATAKERLAELEKKVADLLEVRRSDLIKNNLVLEGYMKFLPTLESLVAHIGSMESRINDVMKSILSIYLEMIDVNKKKTP